MAEGWATFPSGTADSKVVTDDSILEDDWDDDFGGFEGASPVPDDVTANQGSVEASPSPWAAFTLAAAPPDLVQSQISSPPIQKPSPATPLDDPKPQPIGALAASSHREVPPSEVKLTDDLPEAERGQDRISGGQEMVSHGVSALDSIDVSLDDIEEDDALLTRESTHYSNQGASTALAEGARQSVEGQLPSQLSSSNNRDAATVSVPPSSVMNEKKVQNLEEKLSAAEVEKANLLKLKEDLMKRVSELEEDVKEKTEALAAQSKIYQEMDSRHQKQLEEIREAGHQTLAIMVEEYKELCRKTVIEQQERSEKQLEDALRKETERCEELLQKQQDVFNTLLDEERQKGEERIKMALNKYQELQKEKLASILEEERERSKELLEKEAKSVDEKQIEALNKAVQSEREEGQRLLEEQGNLMKKALEEERKQCQEIIKQALEEERSKSKEAIKVALAEQKQQQKEAQEESIKTAQEEMVRFCAEQRKMDNAKRQRSFAVMDLFLNGIQKQLKDLMDPDTMKSSEIQIEGEST
ncbi:Coiled-coil domain-containing protein 91 [Holothuria leucospilota]|uniref:Coiled-coil domain-containing protein 91 n=1 Tax=Holothuria leucospilota TaxID=206669 RepID=A0A9Q0YML4_HOLLE|nr:Coiled-coil domain-containing protein 91 [Holothuria leucospilota]